MIKNGAEFLIGPTEVKKGLSDGQTKKEHLNPEQVRKLAGWGLTQNDIASLRRLESVPHQPGFLIVLRP